MSSLYQGLGFNHGLGFRSGRAGWQIWSAFGEVARIVKRDGIIITTISIVDSRITGETIVFLN